MLGNQDMTTTGACIMDRQVSVDDMMDWEDGNMTPENEIKFFQKLVDNGMAWTLQGMYGRRAVELLNEGKLIKRSV